MMITSGARREIAARAGFEKPVSLDSESANERFRQVVMPHLVDALALARWLTGNADDAEDVVQDACVQALSGIGSYAGRGARPWLLAIVRNACFQWLAKNRPRSLVLVGDMAEVEDAAGERALDEPEQEVELMRQADAAEIARALQTLALPYREVLVMRDINELSYKEIASMLAVPIGTVMSRLSRGRAQLAAAIRRSS